MGNDDWRKAWTDTIAKRVKEIRAEKDMTGDRLSTRTKELGYEIPRSTLANIEIGRKSSVGVHEVVILAAALEVPPVSLMFDVGNDKLVELLPNDYRAQIEASSWFSGLQPLLPKPGLRQYGSFSPDAVVNGYPQVRDQLEDKEFRKPLLARGFEAAMVRYFEVAQSLSYLQVALDELNRGMTPAYSMLNPEFASAGAVEYEQMINSLQGQAREYRKILRAFHNDALMAGAQIPFLDTEIRRDILDDFGDYDEDGEGNGQAKA